MQKRLFGFCLLWLAVGLALPCTAGAQGLTVPESFRNFELGKGDTIVFKYNDGTVGLDDYVSPVTVYEFRSRRGDLNCFYEGFLWYHPRGTKKNPYWVYHSAFPDSYEGTLITAINDIPMVLVDIQKADKRVGNPFDILLLNTRYGDTIRFRKYRSSELTRLPDSIYVPRLSRQLKDRLRGGLYYVPVDLASYRQGDEVIRDTADRNLCYRPVRVVDCCAMYSMKGAWVPNYGNIANWASSYHVRPSEPEVRIYLEDAEGQRYEASVTPVYTRDEIERQKRR